MKSFELCEITQERIAPFDHELPPSHPLPCSVTFERLARADPRSNESVA